MEKIAKLYRMKTEDHLCPFGLKSKDLLEKEGYRVVDHPLESREETDKFKEQYGVETTPQTFIDDKRVGGYDDLREYFSKAPKQTDGTTYQPVIAIFSVAFLMALAWTWTSFSTVRLVELFIAVSMCILAIQKLQDLFSFSNQFITYDLLAKRWINYSYVYPFAEVFAGIGMIAMISPWIYAPLSLFIGTVGAVSVIKAVYIDKRELKCACVGGGSNVPLGFISLTENLMMMAMGLWMLIK